MTSRAPLRATASSFMLLDIIHVCIYIYKAGKIQHNLGKSHISGEVVIMILQTYFPPKYDKLSFFDDYNGNIGRQASDIRHLTLVSKVTYHTWTLAIAINASATFQEIQGQSMKMIWK